MIHANAEFHNVGELRPMKGGLRLQRVPEATRDGLEDGARMRVTQPDNCEIRYCSESDESFVTLSSFSRSTVTLFHGMFDSRERHTIGIEPKRIRVAPPRCLQDLDRRYWKDDAFAPNVRRLIFGTPHREPIIFHGIEGDGIRPPHADELPRLRYLAYGTSITHGFDCSAPHLSYVAHVSRMLGADLINLGVAGAALCESAFADHIATRGDWDIATLALSVNMVPSFTPEDFYTRVFYMVDQVASRNPSKPVLCITLYPFFDDFGCAPADHVSKAEPERYREALRRAVADAGHANLHLAEGAEILQTVSGLTADLIHPSDLGMFEMGQNLAARLKSLLPQF